MKVLLLILAMSLYCLAENTEINPYENYDREPIFWLILKTIGGSLSTTAAINTNMDSQTRTNLIQSGSLLFSITTPIIIVKYIKHHKYLKWVEEHPDIN